jgi:hypothetical protein
LGSAFDEARNIAWLEKFNCRSLARFKHNLQLASTRFNDADMPIAVFQISAPNSRTLNIGYSSKAHPIVALASAKTPIARSLAGDGEKV